MKPIVRIILGKHAQDEEKRTYSHIARINKAAVIGFANKAGKLFKNNFIGLVAVLICTACWFAWRPIMGGSPGPQNFADTPYPTGVDVVKLRVMTANVGNSDLGCFAHYSWGLCYNDVEQRLAESIQELRPDIVTLQEITHPSQCEGWEETDPDKVCYGYQTHNPAYQARRLLGEGYTIACEPRNHRDCLGVHVEAGSIEGCPLGSYCEDIGTSDVPLPGCNGSFTISAFTTIVHDQPIRVVNGHPASRSERCRTDSIGQIFEPHDGQLPLVSGERNLIMGDLNMDPFRYSDTTTTLWGQFVGMPGSGLPFTYHSGPAEHWPPYDTFVLGLFHRVLDFVVSDFAAGSCQVLGVSPDTQRIDGGRGMDHRAVYCVLEFARGGIRP